MTSETSTSTSTRKSSSTAEAEADARNTVAVAASQVSGAIQGVSKQVPQVARASRGAIDDLYKMIDSSSDERVTAGVTLSLGLAIGMLLGGAPRLLILAALAPVAAMGLVLQDRRKRSTSTRATAAS